ncbi:alpha/beta fold hydrolase [Paenibacillus sp. LMG 31458]|uniref:Alpha/beta fold hydrolase n=2 Tax=Paenibacillus phytorum TaxID=2654977 RepID=A0ABX1XYZ7_9BACL|nr:alpha/beta fold hydrolase [Paenibacillus phytorum]
MQMGKLAQMYKDTLGFNVLIPDARGHGRSEGHYIGFGWPERKDYVQWIDKVIEHMGEQSKIVLHGVSMGGATVMMTSGEALPPNVKAIVEDCGYTTAKDQLAYQLKRMYRLPIFPLLHLTSLLTKLRAGYFFGEASALDQLQKSKTPMLFIHGDADLFVPTDSDQVRYDREVAQFIRTYVKE